MKFPTDIEFLAKDVRIQDLQAYYRNKDEDEKGRRRARLLMELASLSKRMINEAIAMEELLSPEGMLVASEALYAIEWRQRYFEAEKRWLRESKMNYWTRLWKAIRGKKDA